MADSKAGYLAYLESVHGAMNEACVYIDWAILELHGLPHAEERRAAATALASDISLLTGKLSKDPPPHTSVLPTFGVSLGMLYSLEEGVRVGRRMTRIAARTIPDLGEGQKSILKRRMGAPGSLSGSLVDWVNGLDLTQGDRDEALIAAKACVEFARRHISKG